MERGGELSAGKGFLGGVVTGEELVVVLARFEELSVSVSRVLA